MFTLVYAGVLPLGETIALRTISAESGYGRVRLWGSVSCLLAAALGGAVLELAAVLSAEVIVSMILVCIVLMIAGSFAMPDRRGGGAAPAVPILSLLRERRFLSWCSPPPRSTARTRCSTASPPCTGSPRGFRSG